MWFSVGPCKNKIAKAEEIEFYCETQLSVNTMNIE